MVSFQGEVLLDALLFGLDLQVGVEISKPRWEQGWQLCVVWDIGFSFVV